MQEDFESHPVTQELDGGIFADNISNTLKGNFSNNKGKNLYSFIGFSEETPTNSIRRFLDPKSKFGPKLKLEKVNKSQGSFTFKITAPDKDAIFDSTPMPWASGLSWAKRIEQGIPGLGMFLNKIGIKGSRSGGGIQVENKLRPARYTPVRYISDIINKFIKRATTKK
jgi:hypothetical protein